MDAASTGNSTALTSEITNRINADDSIKNNLATEKARAMTAEDALNTAAQTALNTKVNIGDTSAMLSPYAKVAATQTAINTKVNITDTASMLSAYARTQRMIDSLTEVRNGLALKLNIGDTAAMLAPYATVASSTAGLNTKVNISDTTAMLLPYAKAAALTGFVDLATDQTISGIKTYNSGIVAPSFIKSGGTSAQILAADGSVITAGTNISISSGTISTTASPVREVTDEFAATVAQTSFQLTQTPSVNSKVKMYINGIRISNTAYDISGTTLTYKAVNNGAYALTVNDRIQFDYYY